MGKFIFLAHFSRGMIMFFNGFAMVTTVITRMGDELERVRLSACFTEKIRVLINPDTFCSKAANNVTIYHVIVQIKFALVTTKWQIKYRMRHACRNVQTSYEHFGIFGTPKLIDNSHVCQPLNALTRTATTSAQCNASWNVRFLIRSPST